MPRLSESKKTKISEQVLYYLFTRAPSSEFTATIANELVRDEEFIKHILEILHKKGLVVLVDKNSDGKVYQKRQRWRLSNQAYDIYARKQASLLTKKPQINSNNAID